MMHSYLPRLKTRSKTMTAEKYYNEIDNAINRVKSMLDSKRSEYAEGDIDPLHNFNVGAGLTGEDRKKVLAGYMLKHTVSVYDMIYSGKEFPISKWDEKITDHIAYLLILRVILSEEHEFESGKLNDHDASLEDKVAECVDYILHGDDKKPCNTIVAKRKDTHK